MCPSLALQTHREAIREIALRHRVLNVRVFGSVLHGENTEAIERIDDFAQGGRRYVFPTYNKLESAK